MGIIIDVGYHEEPENLKKNRDYIQRDILDEVSNIKVGRIEYEKNWMECPEAIEYLDCFGYQYDGGCMLKGKEKVITEEDDSTWPLVYTPMDLLLWEIPGLLLWGWRMASEIAEKGTLTFAMPTDVGLLEAIYYLKPLGNKGEIYIQANSYRYLQELEDRTKSKREYEIFEETICKKNIEWIIDGKPLKELIKQSKFPRYGRKLLAYMKKLSLERNRLSRELDARIFDMKKEKTFEPYETTLDVYLNENEDTEYIEHLRYEWERQWKKTGERDDFLRDAYIKRKICQECEQYRMLINEENFSYYRQGEYPIYQLLLINGEWKFQLYCSKEIKCFPELLDEILMGEISGSERWKKKDFGDVQESFTMVLDGIYSDVERYWEHILCFVKYTPREKTIEICDREKVLPEFHELLQKSVDLVRK